jgi:segregation and condensation protein A
MDSRLSQQEGDRYKVQIPVFEGPLDLLLGLIERAELEITAVSLAAVTNQFLAYLAVLEERQAAEISSFLVVAAKLLQLKSEALLPRAAARAPGDEDPGENLVEQLKLYRRFKRVGLWLLERQKLGLRTHIRIAPPPKAAPKLDLSGLTSADLVEAAQRAFSRENEKAALGTVIAAPRITILEKLELITRTLRRLQHASFHGLLQGNASRLEVVVTFLALLELVKRYRVAATQGALFSDIRIERIGDWSDNEELELEFE